ncbi:MAG: helix-turn-helix transcriptional regulator [Eubacterium sp.]|nr:helix-turn-helix transcriptional regulator [Eubacterium sp.]
MAANEKLKNCLRKNLLIKRDELNITQERMAELLDLSRKGYQKLESGKSFCSGETLVNFVNNFDVDAQQLFSEFSKAIENSEE